MAKRGRKSGAELTALPTPPEALPQRPEPPPGLSEAAAVRWRQIVGALPADYWRPSDLDLLEQLVIEEQYVRDCDALISEHGRLVTGATGALVSNPAVVQRRGHMATILAIQRALRLPPSTRYDKKAAKLGQTTGKRPWQV